MEFGRDIDIMACDSGEEALDLLFHTVIPRRPEIIILDYHLPGISGMEVLNRLRECQDERPVILVTGCNEQKLALKALRFGAYDFVTKGSGFTENLTGAVARAHEHSMLRNDLELTQLRIAAMEVPGGREINGHGTPELVNLGQRLETLGAGLIERFSPPDDDRYWNLPN